MASTWWDEQTKLLIALWSEGLDLSSRKLSLVLFSPQAHDGYDTRGSHAIRRHFVSHCEVTLRIVFEFSQI